MTRSGVTLRVRVDLGAMAVKEYSTFPKAPTLLEPQLRIVLGHIIWTFVGGFLLSTEMKSVYSAALADWARMDFVGCVLSHINPFK